MEKSIWLLIGLRVYSSSFGVIILSNLILNGDALITIVSLSVFLIFSTQIKIMSNFKNHNIQAIGFNMYIMISLAIYAVTSMPYFPSINLTGKSK